MMPKQLILFTAILIQLTLHFETCMGLCNGPNMITRAFDGVCTCAAGYVMDKQSNQCFITKNLRIDNPHGLDIVISFNIQCADPNFLVHGTFVIEDNPYDAYQNTNVTLISHADFFTIGVYQGQLFASLNYLDKFMTFPTQYIVPKNTPFSVTMALLQDTHKLYLYVDGIALHYGTVISGTQFQSASSLNFFVNICSNSCQYASRIFYQCNPGFQELRPTDISYIQHYKTGYYGQIQFEQMIILDLPLDESNGTYLYSYGSETQLNSIYNDTGAYWVTQKYKFALCDYNAQTYNPDTNNCDDKTQYVQGCAIANPINISFNNSYQSLSKSKIYNSISVSIWVYPINVPATGTTNLFQFGSLFNASVVNSNYVLNKKTQTNPVNINNWQLFIFTSSGLGTGNTNIKIFQNSAQKESYVDNLVSVTLQSSNLYLYNFMGESSKTSFCGIIRDIGIYSVDMSNSNSLNITQYYYQRRNENALAYFSMDQINSGQWTFVDLMNMTTVNASDQGLILTTQGYPLKICQPGYLNQGSSGCTLSPTQGMLYSNQNTLMQCENTLNLLQSIQTCDCKSAGFYPLSSKTPCFFCHPSCEGSSCVGPRIDQCISHQCHQAFEYNPTTKTCACPYGQSIVGEPNDGPLICKYVCGNGVLTENEECDDGNYVSGDGCSSQCKKESNKVISALVITGFTTIRVQFMLAFSLTFVPQPQGDNCLSYLTPDVVTLFGTQSQCIANTSYFDIVIGDDNQITSNITNLVLNLNSSSFANIPTQSSTNFTDSIKNIPIGLNASIIPSLYSPTIIMNFSSTTLSYCDNSTITLTVNSSLLKFLPVKITWQILSNLSLTGLPVQDLSNLTNQTSTTFTMSMFQNIATGQIQEGTYSLSVVATNIMGYQNITSQQFTVQRETSKMAPVADPQQLMLIQDDRKLPLYISTAFTLPKCVTDNNFYTLDDLTYQWTYPAGNLTNIAQQTDQSNILMNISSFIYKKTYNISLVIKPSMYSKTNTTLTFQIQVLPLPLNASLVGDHKQNASQGLLVKAGTSVDLETGLNSGYSFSYKCIMVNQGPGCSLDLSSYNTDTIFIPKFLLATSTMYTIQLTITDLLNATRISTSTIDILVCFDDICMSIKGPDELSSSIFSTSSQYNLAADISSIGNKSFSVKSLYWMINDTMVTKDFAYSNLDNSLIRLDGQRLDARYSPYVIYLYITDNDGNVTVINKTFTAKNSRSVDLQVSDLGSVSIQNFDPNNAYMVLASIGNQQFIANRYQTSPEIYFDTNNTENKEQDIIVFEISQQGLIGLNYAKISQGLKLSYLCKNPTNILNILSCYQLQPTTWPKLKKQLKDPLSQALAFYMSFFGDVVTYQSQWSQGVIKVRVIEQWKSICYDLESLECYQYLGKYAIMDSVPTQKAFTVPDRLVAYRIFANKKNEITFGYSNVTIDPISIPNKRLLNTQYDTDIQSQKSNLSYFQDSDNFVDVILYQNFSDQTNAYIMTPYITQINQLDPVQAYPKFSTQATIRTVKQNFHFIKCLYMENNDVWQRWINDDKVCNITSIVDAPYYLNFVPQYDNDVHQFVWYGVREYSQYYDSDRRLYYVTCECNHMVKQLKISTVQNYIFWLVLLIQAGIGLFLAMLSCTIFSITEVQININSLFESRDEQTVIDLSRVKDKQKAFAGQTAFLRYFAGHRVINQKELTGWVLINMSEKNFGKQTLYHEYKLEQEVHPSNKMSKARTLNNRSNTHRSQKSDYDRRKLQSITAGGIQDQKVVKKQLTDREGEGISPPSGSDFNTFQHQIKKQGSEKPSLTEIYEDAARQQKLNNIVENKKDRQSFKVRANKKDNNESSLSKTKFSFESIIQEEYKDDEKCQSKNIKQDKLRVGQFAKGKNENEEWNPKMRKIGGGGSVRDMFGQNESETRDGSLRDSANTIKTKKHKSLNQLALDHAFKNKKGLSISKPEKRKIKNQSAIHPILSMFDIFRTNKQAPKIKVDLENDIYNQVNEEDHKTKSNDKNDYSTLNHTALDVSNATLLTKNATERTDINIEPEGEKENNETKQFQPQRRGTAKRVGPDSRFVFLNLIIRDEIEDLSMRTDNKYRNLWTIYKLLCSMMPHKEHRIETQWPWIFSWFRLISRVLSYHLLILIAYFNFAHFSKDTPQLIVWIGIIIGCLFVLSLASHFLRYIMYLVQPASFNFWYEQDMKHIQQAGYYLDQLNMLTQSDDDDEEGARKRKWTFMQKYILVSTYKYIYAQLLEKYVPPQGKDRTWIRLLFYFMIILIQKIKIAFFFHYYDDDLWTFDFLRCFIYSLIGLIVWDYAINVTLKYYIVIRYLRNKVRYYDQIGGPQNEAKIKKIIKWMQYYSIDF